MMRALVAALLLANLGFFAWTRGLLDAVVGMPAHGGREPERLTRQVRPELIRVLPALPPATPASTPAPTACLQAGPFALAEMPGADAALPAGAARRYAAVKVELPPVWAVYMGRFADAEGVRRKTEELDRIRLTYEPVGEPPDLAPGLSLGRFADRAAAQAALARLEQRGVRTARVVQLGQAASAHWLRFEAADPALAAQLAALGDGPFATRRFATCAQAGTGAIAMTSAR